MSSEESEAETERGSVVAAATPAASIPAASKNPRESELLADPPETGVGGGFEGYRAGRRVRRILFGIIAVAVPISIWTGMRIRGEREERRRTGAPTYQIAEGGEARSRELVWSSGSARLGMSREPPGVDTIILPDRVLTLGEGSDHAQLKVDVQGGKTVELEVLFGVVVEQPLTDAEGSSRDPQATAP